ncbi:SRPBCC family protein [Streptomyces sp. NPDC008238]
MADRHIRLRQDGGRHQAVEGLQQAIEQYLLAWLHRVLVAAGQRLGSVSVRVENDPAATLNVLAQGGRKLSEGKSPARVILELTGEATKSHLRKRLSALTPGRGRAAKTLTIIASIDVGVPLAVAYDQWAQVDEYGLWAEGVKTVETADDTTIHWKGRLLGIRGGRPMKISEKVIDRRIAWTSGETRYVSQAVATFHPLADDLTKVVLTLVYAPRGLTEKAAALCRIPVRQAHRDLMLFARYVTLQHAALGDEKPPVLLHEASAEGETYEDEDGGEDDEPEGEAHGSQSAPGTGR